ncbi:MAG: diguanylate cyclase [Clostridiales Family XIII bacterium]|nr:diguanylate cyclase [Clostridiales Family XIII bacterium]
MPEDFQKLGAGLVFFSDLLKELRDFEKDLARGELSGKMPGRDNELAARLKDLHASLKHLTWQTKQVASGDYSQRVEFMGEFSDAFNEMVAQLNSRTKALNDELKVVQAQAIDLARSNSLFESISSNITEWIVMIDRETGEHIFSNHPIKNDLNNEILEEQLFDILFSYIKDIDPSASTVTKQFPLVGDTEIQYFSAMLYPVHWREKDAVAVVLTDITKEKEVLKELEHIAYHDTLTGAYNRHYGMKLLSDWIEKNLHFVICFLDLDRLKYVNDAFGHNEGDNYIVSVSRILTRFSRNPYICRLGGDEFMILTSDCNQAEAEEKLERLREEMVAKEYANEDGSVTYKRSFSYGVVEVSGGNKIPTAELLSVADEKMYEYKKAHKAERNSKAKP